MVGLLDVLRSWRSQTSSPGHFLSAGEWERLRACRNFLFSSSSSSWRTPEDKSCLFTLWLRELSVLRESQPGSGLAVPE